jgi:toxin ParE1/3/4
MRLRWDRRAIEDLEAIYAWIAADNPQAAAGVVARIRKSVGRLETFPMSGRRGVTKTTRLLTVPRVPYVVVRRVRRETVDILAVLHPSPLSSGDGSDCQRGAGIMLMEAQLWSALPPCSRPIGRTE